jgi:alpha-L-rhamnosidase
VEIENFKNIDPITMKKFLLALAIFLVPCISLFAKLSVVQLRTENQINPIGMDVKVPRFTWYLESEKRNTLQKAYEIRISKSENFRQMVWTSGKVESDQSVLVEYEGSPLESNTTYFWQVRTWDNHGQSSGWSKTGSFRTGYFDPADWSADWVGLGFEEDENRSSPYFRKEFSSTKKIKSATAYITARGLYQAYLNGEKIGNDYLTPGWTAYQDRIQYQVYDVTDKVKSKNVLGVVLGSGWYRGYIGFSGQENYYGDEISFLMELVLEYADGTKERILSDDSWRCNYGPILSADIYNGEIYDARMEMAGWNKEGFNQTNWKTVQIKDYGYESLVATYNEPIRKQETFKPIEMITTPKGEKVLDFGQNLVGWVQFKVKGKSGDKFRVTHAEILDKDGNFYTENLRAAKAELIYTLKEGEQTYEPHFTFFGFRYIRIDDFEGDIIPEDFTAVALYSDMEKTGEFASSHELINQLQHNIQWGQRGNFLDVPTDCPQRDERLGWTGDAQAFSRTAAYNFNVHSFFTKWLKDLELDQREDGAVPFVIPNVLGKDAAGSAGWADAATIIPWDMYMVYGDRRILEEQYESMVNWVGFMESNSKDHLWNTGFHFGDWLFYRPDDDNDGRAAVTDKYLIAQCFFAHSVQIMIYTAKVLGKEADQKNYEALLKNVKDAFLKEYVTPNGRLVSSTQTAYVLALHFDMLPESMREDAAKRLVENIRSYGVHLTTGFLGTPYLNHVLSRFGYDDLAFELLLREKYPSWLYPVTMGATTIWERWDGIKPNGDVQVPSMNSYNHYAYGAIGDWMYRNLAGIDTDPEHPGYKEFVVKPLLGGGFTHAKGALDTYYGKIVSEWKLDNGQFSLEVQVPVNTRATVYIPSTSSSTVKENNNSISSSQSLKILGEENGYVKVEIGSGIYTFTR